MLRNIELLKKRNYKMKLTDFDIKSNFEKLLVGLIEGEDVTNFSVEKDEKKIQILVGDWSLELHGNGKWEIN